MSILVVGSIVLDHIRSPYGSSKGALGGSAVYFAGAASHYAPVRLVGVVGDDFPKEGNDFLAQNGIDTEGLT
ncbi:MAG: sugar kinase, partial [Gemmatimonadetes bacterium]|nr:sugar kinase [Gemmatimonadota bacterium]